MCIVQHMQKFHDKNLLTALIRYERQKYFSLNKAHTRFRFQKFRTSMHCANITTFLSGSHSTLIYYAHVFLILRDSRVA